MKLHSFWWLGGLAIVLLAWNSLGLPVTAQGSCPGGDLFISEPRGADTESCGAEDAPCQTLEWGLTRVESCQVPVTMRYDNGAIEFVLGVFDQVDGLGPVDGQLPGEAAQNVFLALLTALQDDLLWGALFGLGLGLLAVWRGRQPAQVMGMLLLLLALDAVALQAQPALQIGSCPGSRAHYRPAGSNPTGADNTTCGGSATPCASFYQAWQRAASCDNAVKVIKIRADASQVWVSTYVPPQGGGGNEPYQPALGHRRLAFAASTLLIALVVFYGTQSVRSRNYAATPP